MVAGHPPACRCFRQAARNEPHRDAPPRIVFGPFGEFNELLASWPPIGITRRPELLLKRRRYPLSSCGDQDDVEPLVAGSAERSVALAKLDVGIAEIPDPLLGLCEERSMSFDRAYLPCELSRDGRGVTQSGPD